ncbi:protein jag [bacterium]|nr:MAG: protein jag [bacterium]
MQSVELSAKTVDEARKAAATKLGVAEGALTVTVLEETKGLFGKSTVRVRAEVTPVPVAAAAPPAVETPAEKPTRGGRGRKPAAEPAPEPVGQPEPVAVPAVVEEEPKGRGRGRGRGKKEEAPVAAASTEEAPAAQEERSETVATADDGEKLAGLLRELLESAGMQVNVTLGEISGRYVSLKLDGKDAAYLVGKHGEVLNALQYLVNVVAHRRLGTEARATLDGNDYRKRREDVLTQMASNIASQVKERGEEAVLDALPAFERRIVHKALQEIDGVITYSEGEEPNRRVVIAPAE